MIGRSNCQENESRHLHSNRVSTEMEQNVLPPPENWINDNTLQGDLGVFELKTRTTEGVSRDQ